MAHNPLDANLDQILADISPDELLMPLRYFGDQVLRRDAAEVTELNGDIVALGRRMLVTMDHEVGIGLAGPQVGRMARIISHGLPEEAPPVLVNPVVVESSGEWVYQEGCLSIPGLYFDVVRPKQIHLRAWTPEGQEVDIDADELLARVCLHEIDHLDGVLFLDRITPEDRAVAEAELQKRVAGTLGTSDPFLTGRAIRALLRRAR